MTFIEAICEIFKKNGNLPMTSKEIWSEISKQDLVLTKGKTPWASVNAIILYNSKNSPIKNKKKVKSSMFEITQKSPMKFRLSNYPTSSKINNDDDISVLNTIDEKILLYSITSSDFGWRKISIYNNGDNIEYEISDCVEYTYIMEDKAHATIKIGKTKNDPEQRLNQLKTGNPSISLLHVFPSIQFSEADLHSKFEDFRKDLEWFFKTKGLEKFLNDEIRKHNSILKFFNKKRELIDIEEEMINLI